MKTVYGIKQTMTQAWDKSGKRHPVTVVKVDPMLVTRVKTQETDGYQAIQVGIGKKPAKRLNKPLKNQLKAVIAGDQAPKKLKEIRLKEEVAHQAGESIPASAVLSVGDRVTVSSISKGRGFSGVMKRWGFGGGPRTHGQSDRARAPGSIGQGTDPGRVHKGKKMAGRFGNQRFTLKNLTVLKIDEAENTVWLSGPIPGSAGSIVTITAYGETSFPGLIEKETDAPTKETVKTDEVTESTEPVEAKPEETETKEAAKTEAADKPEETDKKE